MKKILFIGLFFILYGQAFSQNITGDWYGILKVPNQELRIIFHVVLDSNRYLSTMDVPAQGAKRLLMDSTFIVDNHIRMKMTQYNIYYNGTYYQDSSLIRGIFNQGGFSTPLILSRKPQSLLPTEIRPQEPTSFAYKQEEISFTNPKSSNTLSGTLSLPASGKVNKLVILIAGSGPNNRDEELKVFNQKPFLVWSDFLTKNGIAVLRYDKRGIGKSTGDYQKATTYDFESDVMAALSFVRSRPDLKNLEIGLMGHSEGGLIAPMVASVDKNIKFVILLAGPGVPIPELMVKQNYDAGKLQGLSDTQLKYAESLNNKIYKTVNDNKSLTTAELNSKLEGLLTEELKANNSNKLTDEKIAQIAKAQAPSITSSWFRTFLSIIPESNLSKLTCPVLALNGTLDFQVNAESNLAAIKSSLEKAGNKNYEVVPMEGLNHLFQKAKTGSLKEYGEIPESVNPMALNKVLDWINKLP